MQIAEKIELPTTTNGKAVESASVCGQNGSKKGKKIHRRQLKQMIIEAARCDEQMKTGEKDKWLALEMFLERARRKIGEPA